MPIRRKEGEYPPSFLRIGMILIIPIFAATVKRVLPYDTSSLSTAFFRFFCAVASISLIRFN